jgi:hypothetical protein
MFQIKSTCTNQHPEFVGFWAQSLLGHILNLSSNCTLADLAAPSDTLNQKAQQISTESVSSGQELFRSVSVCGNRTSSGILPKSNQLLPRFGSSLVASPLSRLWKVFGND